MRFTRPCKVSRRAELRRVVPALIAALGLGAGGCGFSHVNRDFSERPERATGSAARVMMPGDPPASMTEPVAQEPTLLGGGSAESDGSRRQRNVPLGPLTTLFGYPFWIFGKSVSEEADEAVSERGNLNEQARPTSTASAPERPEDPGLTQTAARVDRENDRMREQLQGAAGKAQAQPRAAVREIGRAGGGTTGASDPALRDELAALRRTLASSASGAGATDPGPSADRASADRASADRDGDGRRDRWISQGAEGSREALDENGDGRADRVRVYDAARRLLRTEDDLDRDGSFEVVTLYVDGEMSERLEDTDNDGATDRWVFYEGGNLARVELDNDGDGRAERISRYTLGELVREETDADGDGRPESIVIYEQGEIAERRVDADSDGAPESISYYSRGKLVRRELMRPAPTDGAGER